MQQRRTDRRLAALAKEERLRQVGDRVLKQQLDEAREYRNRQARRASDAGWRSVGTRRGGVK